MATVRKLKDPRPLVHQQLPRFRRIPCAIRRDAAEVLRTDVCDDLSTRVRRPRPLGIAVTGDAPLLAHRRCTRRCVTLPMPSSLRPERPVAQES